MARIRSVHPKLWKDPTFVAVSPSARLLFLGLRNFVPRNEQFEWDPILLKATVFPKDRINVTPLLDELLAAGLVRRRDFGERAVGNLRRL